MPEDPQVLQTQIFELFKARTQSYDHATLAKRKSALNLLYLEALLLVDRDNHVSFEKILKMLSYRVLDSDRYLKVDEQARRRALLERMYDYMCMERVNGFLYNVALKRVFRNVFHSRRDTRSIIVY